MLPTLARLMACFLLVTLVAAQTPPLSSSAAAAAAAAASSSSSSSSSSSPSSTAPSLSPTSSDNAGGSFYAQEAEKWCSYLQKTPEPPLVVYNRLPKCGSSTIQALLSILSQTNLLNKTSTTKVYWGDHELDPKLEFELEYLINNLHPGRFNRTLVIDGHWYQYKIPSDRIKGIRPEYIQLVRDCASHQQSWFLYSLFDSAISREFHYKGNVAEQSFHSQFLNTNLSAAECLQNYTCLRHANQIDFSGGELRYLCGSGCAAFFGNNVEVGALHNVLDPATFSVVGTLEALEEYLEMLECAYPTALSGLAALYNSTRLHAKVSTHSEVSSALGQLIGEACDARTNPYSRVYSETAKLAHARFQFMQTHRDRCCRPRKP